MGLVRRRAAKPKMCETLHTALLPPALDCHVQTSAPWLDDLKTEILAFPFGMHDDQVDSISQALNWISRPRSKPYFSSLGSARF
jgi:phage terminase large subunit-like protein